MPLPDFRVPTSACPFCDQGADAAANVTGLHAPKAGDAMLCSSCGAWSVYTAAMTRRAPSTDETERIAADPAAQRVWWAWLAWVNR